MIPSQVRDTGGKPILVIGGGIAGVTTAVEAAEAGCEVILVETLPYLGGRVARAFRYFPKLCPPGCGLEINFRRIKQNPRIQVLTQATVDQVAGTPGDYEATITVAPRFVTDACTLCDKCAEACPAERADEFNLGMGRTKAAYLPHPMAFPPLYAIDRAACPDGCTACRDACAYGAIDLTQQPERRRSRSPPSSRPPDGRPTTPRRSTTWGSAGIPTSSPTLMLERLAAPDGPTRGADPASVGPAGAGTVAFVQCAGSRDENHLPYCSAVCCCRLAEAGDLHPRASIPRRGPRSSTSTSERRAAWRTSSRR